MWIGLYWLTVRFGVELFGHWDTRWRSWLRHCATTRKVAGLIPVDIIGFFTFLMLSVALWPWDRLLGGNGGRCLGLTTLPPSFTDCLESWKLHPAGTLKACPGLYRVSFTSAFSFCTLWVKLNLQAPCVLYIGQAFRYSPENAFYIFNQQIYLIIRYLLDRASLM